MLPNSGGADIVTRNFKQIVWNLLEEKGHGTVAYNSTIE